MAYLRKRKSGKWQVIIRKKNYPYVVRSFLEKSTASKFAKDVETQMDKQIFQDLTGASTTTLKELMIKYRDEIVPSQKACRQTTATLNMLMKHRIAFYSLTQLKSAHLYKLKKEMLVGRAPKTVNGYIQLLSLIWKTAKKVWSISLPAESPFELVTLDKVNNQRDVIISKEEEKKLIAEAAKSRMNNLADMIKFAILVGARWSEIVALERKNVCFNKKTATFMLTKTTSSHTIPLHDDAIAILKKYPFGDRFFNVKTRESFRHFWEKVREEAGLPTFRYHDLRSFGANRYLLSGMSEIEVAALGNWKTLAVLHRRYSRIKPTQLLHKINNVVNLK